MAQKSILITGCSSGIGHHAAHALARRGWTVLATCRKPVDCARLRAEGLDSFPLDLADEDSIRAAVAMALQATDGRLDALFNNGAYAIPGLVEDLPRAALREIFEVNLFGQFDLIRQVLPVMRAQGSGRIVNNSSVLGFVGLKVRAAYCGTKFAMEGMTDVLRMELADDPVDVILLEPGPIESRIRQNSIPHFEHFIDWEASANAAFYRDVVRPRLYDDSGTPDRFQLTCDATTRALLRALEHPRPKARYRVTTPTHAMNIARRILPTAWLDRVLLRG